MDRLSKGLLAGIIGAIPMNLLNLAFYQLKLADIRFVDYSGIIMLGNAPNDLQSFIYSLFIQIIWSGILGIGLAFLYPHINSNGYYLKGTLYGFLLGFTFRCIVALYRVPELRISTPLSSEINLCAIVLWGLTAAFLIHKFENLRP